MTGKGDMAPATIAVIGAGYVGLVTAACLARLGNTVICIENNGSRLDALRSGSVPFKEPGLDELVVEEVAAGRLRFDDSLLAATGVRMAIVCVGTLDEAGEWTDRFVRRAVALLVDELPGVRVVIIRSTMLPGTTRSIAEDVLGADATVELAVNPEFTREGSAVRDFLAPDRIVIGLTSDVKRSAVEVLSRIYAPLGAPIVVTDATSAEMIKVGSNVFLAMKVAYGNELARICAAVGADVSVVVDGIGLDKRIGRQFLSPGPGFGGSCLPAQARALPALASMMGVSTPIMAAIDVSNQSHADWIVDCLRTTLGSVRGRRVGILGLTFKAGTDDIRESPGIEIARRLSAMGAELVVYDPAALDNGLKALHKMGTSAAGAADPVAACVNADALIVATEWPLFRSLDWSRIVSAMRGRVVMDARQVIDSASAESAGLEVLVHGASSRASSRVGT